jgi:hypothetical protein
MTMVDSPTIAVGSVTLLGVAFFIRSMAAVLNAASKFFRATSGLVKCFKKVRIVAAKFSQSHPIKKIIKFTFRDYFENPLGCLNREFKKHRLERPVAGGLQKNSN